MKTDEIIKVLQAFKEGKKIEVREKTLHDDQQWKEMINPYWAFETYDYRVKPEPEYVPYTSVLEVSRDKWVKEERSSVLSKITALDLDDAICVRVEYDWVSLKDLFENYTYEDGTPCGKKVE